MWIHVGSCACMQVRWGDALDILPELKLPEGSAGIDLLLLDGVPKESLAYLRAAEPLLSDGAVVVADNAGAAASPNTILRACVCWVPAAVGYSLVRYAGASASL